LAVGSCFNLGAKAPLRDEQTTNDSFTYPKEDFGKRLSKFIKEIDFLTFRSGDFHEKVSCYTVASGGLAHDSGFGQG
jgi:hypothetical protein